MVTTTTIKIIIITSPPTTKPTKVNLCCPTLFDLGPALEHS